MTLADFLWSLPGLLLTAWVGRLVLDRLPAGELGSRGPFARIGTSSAALGLGLACLGLETWILEHAFGWRAPLIVLLIPWAVLAGARAAFGPGPVPARAPFHSPPIGARERSLVRVLRLASLAAVVWAAWGFVPGEEIGTPRLRQAPAPLPGHLALEWPLWFLGGERPGYTLYPVALAAIAVLVNSTLALARRAAWSRGVIVFFLVFLPATPDWVELARSPRTVIVGGLGLAIAIAGAVAWLRVADRNGRALALAGFLVTVTFEPRLLGLALCGVVLLGVSSPSGTRRGTWIRIVPVAGLMVLLAGGFGGAGLGPGPAAALFQLANPWGIWSVALLGSLVHLAWRARREGGAVLQRDLMFLGGLLLMAVVLAPSLAGGRATSPFAQAEGARAASDWLALLVPLVAVFVGLASAPHEYTPAPLTEEPRA